MESTAKEGWLKIAVKKNILTQKQIEECLKLQKANPQFSLKDILAKKGYLNKEKLQQINKIIKRLKEKHKEKKQQSPTPSNLFPTPFQSENKEFTNIPTVENEPIPEISVLDVSKTPSQQEEAFEEIMEFPLEDTYNIAINPSEEDILSPTPSSNIDTTENQEVENEFYQEGLEFLSAKQIIRAMNSFGKAIQKDPEFPQGYYQKGLIHHQLSEANEAIDHFSRAIELYPDYVEALEARANVYLEKKEKTKAEHDFMRVIELVPDRQPELSERFYYETGEKSDLQQLMQDIKLDVQKESLNKKREIQQKNLELQRKKLLQRKFETKRISKASMQLEEEKAKEKKERITAIDRTSTLNKDLSSDTQFVSKQALKQEKAKREIEEFPTKAKTEKQKKKRASSTEKKSSFGIIKIFVLLLILALPIGGYIFYLNISKPVNTEMIQKIQSSDYAKWKVVGSQLLNQSIPAPSDSPKSFSDFATLMGKEYQSMLSPICQKNQISLQDFLTISNSLGVIQMKMAEKTKVDKKIQQLERDLGALDELYQNLKEKAEKQGRSVSQAEKEEYEQKVSAVEKALNQQDSYLELKFSEANMEEKLAHNWRLFKENKEDIETLWKELQAKLMK